MNGDQAFEITDLQLEELEVSTIEDSAALPEGSASYKSSSTCIVLLDFRPTQWADHEPWSAHCGVPAREPRQATRCSMPANIEAKATRVLTPTLVSTLATWESTVRTDR